MSHKCVVCSKEFDEKAQYLSHIKRCLDDVNVMKKSSNRSSETASVSSHRSSSTYDVEKLRGQYRELKEVAVKLKKVLEKYSFQIEDLTAERDTLIHELQDEKDRLADLKEKLKKDYNRRFRIYKEYLDMKYAQHGVLPKNQAVIDELKGELNAKEEELVAFKTILTNVQTELKTLQKERDFIIKQKDDEAQSKLLKMHEEHQYQLKMEQKQYSTQVTQLTRKINQLTAENLNLKKDIEKHASSVDVAVSKAEDELRKFFNSQLEAQRINFSREIATRDKLIQEAGYVDVDLVKKMAEQARGYEERIKKLKLDFLNKLNQKIDIERDTQFVQDQREALMETEE